MHAAFLLATQMGHCGPDRTAAAIVLAATITAAADSTVAICDALALTAACLP